MALSMPWMAFLDVDVVQYGNYGGIIQQDDRSSPMIARVQKAGQRTRQERLGCGERVENVWQRHSVETATALPKHSPAQLSFAATGHKPSPASISLVNGCAQVLYMLKS